MGFGIDFDASDELLDRYAATFSKGLRSARSQVAYRALMEDAELREPLRDTRIVN